MEDELKEPAGYSFLREEDAEKHFADLNISLLSGKHIATDDYIHFSLLEKYESEWREYYKNLYKLNLDNDVFDGETYYYLDFLDSGKGKLTENSRHRAMTVIQSITGLMLVDMYYQHYFNEQKVIIWTDIRKQIEESDHKSNYQRILFNTLRPSYSETEWQIAEKKFRDVINSFDKLGWITKQSTIGEELVFEIKPAIHRIAKLYEAELQDFENFAHNIKKEETPV